MSKLKQIENALKAIDPAGFQRLCDSYLHSRGYENINRIGLVIGADKVVRGTPDTLFTQPDGRYVFAEYSTQQEGLAGKFEGDIEKCFNTEKTGIPVEQISEIILCHNSRTDPGEEYRLGEQCRKRGVLLSIYGLSRIAHDLYQKYLGLARDFLNVEVDTGQIVSANEFVTAYNKSTFATPLDTVFHFRNEEIEQALTKLESEDLLLIAGHAGVGKTRFALECCQRYSTYHTDAQTRCIFNRGIVDLFQDLRVHFSPPGHYIILVDDANRVSGFKYVLQLLHDQRNDQKIKIIVTVRDYALEAVLDDTRPFRIVKPLELAPLNEEQVKELVSTEFNIQNFLYLERITDIAQGNPRLAVMAACIVKRENTLASIADVSTLYDEYFRSIREDIGDFKDSKLLQVAGLIAFFRVVDRSNSELMGAISDTFGIDPVEFWQVAQHLHELEAVDMYEKEVIRVSDQVLSTYLFYLSAFRERVLDFAILLEHFFPRFRRKFFDALNPVLSAFDTKAVIERLRLDVDRAWSVIQQRGNEEEFLHLIDAFCFVKETDALLYVRNHIRSLQPEPRPLTELSFVLGTQPVPSPSILSILDNFRYAENAVLRTALTLLLDYIEKRPADLPLVIRMLSERYGITRHSYLEGFRVERQVIDILWERSQGGANEILSRLFLTISEFFLHTHFSTHESKNEVCITVFQFDIPNTEELLDLRQIIWQRIFALYNIHSLQESVLQLFNKHIQSGLRLANHDVIAKDAVQVQRFFSSALDASAYGHCVIVHDYLAMLKRVGVEADEELKGYFRNETYVLSKLLFNDRDERRDLGWEEYQKIKRERLAAHTARFNEAHFAEFFKHCVDILSESDHGRYQYQAQHSIGDVLLNLSERDTTMFETVLNNYLHAGNALDLGSWVLAPRLIETSGVERSYEILSKGKYPGRISWLFGYFRALPSESVNAERIDQLYALYEEATWRDIHGDLDYLLKFTDIDKEVVLRVTRILTNKVSEDINIGQALSGGIFAEHSNIVTNLPKIFAHNVNLLKQAYFAACTAEHHTDYSGQIFNILLDLDPSFAAEWVLWKYKSNEWLSRHDDSRDYSFIWRRDDYTAVIKQIIDTVCANERTGFHLYSYLEVFFTTMAEDANAQSLRDRQDALLDEIIESKHSDQYLMELLFSVIRNFSQERRRGRIITFFRNNQDFEAFKNISLEPNSWEWSGSAVPMLQGRADFFESLLPMLNTVELLQHKQRIEQIIQRLHDNIEHEKKRDFMRD